MFVIFFFKQFKQREKQVTYFWVKNNMPFILWFCSLSAPRHRNRNSVFWPSFGWVVVFFCTTCDELLSSDPVLHHVLGPIRHTRCPHDYVAEIHNLFPVGSLNFVPRLLWPLYRFLGAINLWSIEVVMQLRVYMLFNRSKRVRCWHWNFPFKSPNIFLIKVAFANGVLFIISIGIFLWILIYNQLHRNEEYTVSEVSWVTPASGLPLLYGPPPGLPPPTGPPPRPMPVSECSSVNADSRWAQWIPRTHPLYF